MACFSAKPRAFSVDELLNRKQQAREAADAAETLSQMGDSIEVTERHAAVRKRLVNDINLRGDSRDGCPSNPAMEPCDSTDELLVLRKTRDLTLVADTPNTVDTSGEETRTGIHGRHSRYQDAESL
ncbi:hypothetical protein DPMN_049137 [Dreissena polymorpha]|uniref:Uncharacterized protein n=1 Tax=Dreissena polymorpha TaxID=45954 RepID=A0A9D4DC50_DREPO|nr:hypothetical protein DPMN_049137 [Dreissena polymorpha]